MLIDPDYPDLVQITCIPFAYHSVITGKFIEDKTCFAIRLDTNYYFSMTDLLGEKNLVRKWLNMVTAQKHI